MKYDFWRQANGLVTNAIRRGIMARPSACEVCGLANVSEIRKGRLWWPVLCHHWSYELEHVFDVIPLCYSCHKKVHAGSMPEPRTNMRYTPRDPNRPCDPPPKQPWNDPTLYQPLGVTIEDFARAASGGGA